MPAATDGEALDTPCARMEAPRMVAGEFPVGSSLAGAVLETTTVAAQRVGDPCAVDLGTLHAGLPVQG